MGQTIRNYFAGIRKMAASKMVAIVIFYTVCGASAWMGMHFAQELWPNKKEIEVRFVNYICIDSDENEDLRCRAVELVEPE